MVHPRNADGTTAIRTSKLLIATGAIERSIPIPGWTLPGVITAGGLQSLVKGHSTLPGNSIVLGGSGPFLFPVIESLLDLKKKQLHQAKQKRKILEETLAGTSAETELLQNRLKNLTSIGKVVSSLLIY